MKMKIMKKWINMKINNEIIIKIMNNEEIIMNNNEK